MTARLALLAGTASVLTAAAPAWATDTPAPPKPAQQLALEEVDPGDIVVTARRRQETSQEVPLAIGVLDQRAINETGSSSIYKIQQLAPSLQVYSQNPRNTSVNIRGIGVPFGLTNDGFEQGVGIYVDDVYYARVASAVFDFLDIAQVEVLRGPQGTLYGKNTTAGAINIRTNQPTFDFEGNAELTLGNYNFRQAKAAISGPISDKVAVRLAGSSTSRKGTIYNVTTSNWVNEQDNLGVRGQLLFRPNENLDITLAGDWSAQDPECCATVFVRYGPTQRAAARQFPALAAALGYAPASDDPFDRLTDLDAPLSAGNKTGGASARVVWDIGPGTLTSITAWRFWDWKPENDRDYLGLSIVSASNNPSQQDQYSQELRYNYSSDRLDFVIGAFAFKQRIDTQGLEQAGSDSARWNLTGSSATHAEWLDGLTARNTQWLKTTSIAGFGQLSWHVTDAFTITPGARINYDKKNGHYQREVFQPDGDEILSCFPAPPSGSELAAQCGIYSPLFYEPSFKDWNFSYDINVSYQLAADVLAYATYAKTFKTGGLNQNGVPVDTSNRPIEEAYTIEPESVQHFEAGLKTQFWDHRVTFNLAAFRTTIDDFQANVSNGQYGVLRGYLANADRVRSQGVEIDFSIRPSERFTAYANGAYTDAKYVSFCDAPTPPELSGGTQLPQTGECTYSGTPAAPGTPGSSPPFYDASGEVLPGVSKWSFSYGAEANASVDFFGKAGQAYFGVDGSYRTKFSSNPTPSAYTWVDGYALTNFRLGFRAEGLNIYGWVRNAFDTDYFDQLVVGPSNTGVIAGFPGDPRTWGGTVRLDF